MRFNADMSGQALSYEERNDDREDKAKIVTKDEEKTRDQLLDEVVDLRRRMKELRHTKMDEVFQERLYKILEGGMKAGFYVVQNGKFVFVNDHAAHYWGYRKDELLGMNSMNLVYPEDREWVRENAIKMLKGERSSSYDFRTTNKDGAPRWMTETIAPIEYMGERAVLGISLDITEQMAARNKLAEMEALEASLLEAIPHAVVGLKDRRIIFANEGVESVFGWEAGDLIGKTVGMFYRSQEQSETIAQRLYSTLEKNNTFNAEIPCRRRDGRNIVCMVKASRIGESLKERNIVITYEDITERKRLEDSYKTMAKSSVAGVYIVKDGKFLFVNRHAAMYAEYNEEELVGKDAYSLVHPDDREMVKKNATNMLQGKNHTPYEFRVVTKNGNIRWILETVTLVPYKNEMAILGNSMDITELKEARDKVAELKALETSFLEAIPHAVVGLKDRRIIFANDGIESVFGWKADELIGKSVRVLYRTEKDTKEIGRFLYSALKRHRTFSTEVPCRRKDGQNVDCMVKASRIGEILKERNIVITYEDISESKQAKNELEKSRERLRNLSAHLESIREKERTRIARELHDELGQLLTALHMEIVLLNKKIPPGHHHLMEKTDAMGDLVDMTMKTLKRIYMDLRPGMLDHLGLATAIGWQAGEFEKRTAIKCKVTVYPEDFEINQDLSTAIFRIFQETLTNISRHSEATSATISLKIKNGKVELIVKDNGKGITEEQLSKPNSFGLMGITERAFHWGGKVKINGKKGVGTTVKVNLPLRAKGE
jgi:PAS domain S-box-containing protein